MLPLYATHVVALGSLVVSRAARLLASSTIAVLAVGSNASLPVSVFLQRLSIAEVRVRQCCHHYDD